MKEKISITIDKKILKASDSIIDNVFIRNRSHAIEHLLRQALGDQRSAVILCGGDEEKIRISPTEFRPTARIGKGNLIEYNIKKLRQEGFKNIFIIARHKVLSDIFSLLKDGSSFGVQVKYVEEKASAGTADSLRLAKGPCNSSFLVAYGHVLFTKINISHLWKEHLTRNHLATLLLTTSKKPAEKGVIIMEGSNILDFIQKPASSDNNLVFSPIFVAEPAIFDYAGKSLELDVFPVLAKNGLLGGTMSAHKELHVHNAAEARAISTSYVN
ncbi:hypothetical protein HY772_08435 [Candidatus Woesearchaeota archaeon]|nr:hypothetical protein [Candidatus Woesearchaeota archaeon]